MKVVSALPKPRHPRNIQHEVSSVLLVVVGALVNIRSL